MAAGVAVLLLFAAPAVAQDVRINFGQVDGSGLTERVIQMNALLTVLSLAPSILVMMTSFTRIVVVLSLFLPFLIIDLVIASLLMSMCMIMLAPVVVSLPFKLIFWSLFAGSLIRSYGT